ncbi:hypothetical protein BTA30_18845 [Bacillus swezeyi]|uniref:Uncharacterized protein n=1 Tax=Bacillus swezeyi TaxID=1925020 RepID=A0A1R1Q9U2_9BACI|nr:hypothetical protein BW143_20335 [Bacillus swezeyi]OMI26946.1 hypothetical protein BTA30_18845 [Bacillus swezeyi]
MKQNRDLCRHMFRSRGTKKHSTRTGNSTVRSAAWSDQPPVRLALINTTPSSALLFIDDHKKKTIA